MYRKKVFWTEFDSFKQDESTGGNTEVVSHKVADAKIDIKSTVNGWRRDTFDSYVTIRHNVDQSCVTVSKHLKRMFGWEAEGLEQNALDAFCSAASGAQKSLVVDHEAANISLNVTVQHLKCSELAGPAYSFAHSVRRELQQSQKSAASDSGEVPMSDTLRRAAPAPLGATNLCEHLGRC